MGALNIRAYPDACALIYLVEGHPIYGPAVASRMTAVGQSSPVLVFTELTRLECRVKPLKELNQPLLAGFDKVFETPGYELQALTRPVFELATELRAQHGLKTPDALHLAAAITAGCSEFWTNDDRLNKAAQGRIHTIVLGDT